MNETHDIVSIASKHPAHYIKHRKNREYMGTPSKCKLFIKLRSCHLHIDNMSLSDDTHYWPQVSSGQNVNDERLAAQ